MYWIKYFNKIQFRNGWNLQTEIESRRFISPERSFHLVLPRVHVHKSLNNVDLGVGFAYFLLATPSNPDLDAEVHVPELRPHFDLGLKHNVFGLDLNHRYRLESRFIHKNDGLMLTDGYQFRFRVRYRLHSVIPISKSENNLVSIFFSNEVLLNTFSGSGVPVFDHNRLQLGPRFNISPSIKFDFIYQNWYQQLNNEKVYATYHIVSLTLHHTINLGG